MKTIKVNQASLKNVKRNFIITDNEYYPGGFISSSTSRLDERKLEQWLEKPVFGKAAFDYEKVEMTKQKRYFNTAIAIKYLFDYVPSFILNKLNDDNKTAVNEFNDKDDTFKTYHSYTW